MTDKTSLVNKVKSQKLKEGFTCVSRRTGLSCTNASGNGFFLSRERWRVF